MFGRHSSGICFRWRCAGMTFLDGQRHEIVCHWGSDIASMPLAVARPARPLPETRCGHHRILTSEGGGRRCVTCWPAICPTGKWVRPPCSRLPRRRRRDHRRCQQCSACG
jgi:hypothetical protein